MAPDAPVCPMPAWAVRALVNPAIAIAVSALAWGTCGLSWGYLVIDLAVEVLLHLWRCEVAL